MTVDTAARQPILLPFMIGNLLVLFVLMIILRFNADQIIRGGDFMNVWTAGKLVLADRLDLLYDPAKYRPFMEQLFGKVGPYNYSYPPFVLPLMVPFALLPYTVALVAWVAGTGWLFLRAAAPWWREGTGWPAFLVVLTPAAVVNAWTAHYGFLIGALLIFGWRNIESGRPWLAGVCFGLMAIKPHIALFVPLILLLRGEWRAIIAAAITVALLVLGSMVLFGGALWHDFFTITAGMQTRMIDAGTAFYGKMSTSTMTTLFAFGAPWTIAFIAQCLTGLIGVALVVLAARGAALRDLALLASTATFLVLPYAFNYDLTVSAIGAAIVMTAPAIHRFDRWLAQVGFIAAQLGMFTAMIHVPLMPLFLLGLAIVQYRWAVRPRPPSVSEDILIP